MFDGTKARGARMAAGERATPEYPRLLEELLTRTAELGAAIEVGVVDSSKVGT
ncbi:hypothetical protein GCM10023168_30230 [Fodinibacter luteus]|uniref:Uncharacterized protein n=1 Tax=Fodinibacter luteus TaxID=552064 RepID=A0ABP8KNI0_9MICO